MRILRVASFSEAMAAVSVVVFPAARRARDDHHAMRLGQLVGQDAVVARVEAELVEADEFAAPVEQAQDGGFAGGGGHGGDADVEVATAHRGTQAAVLWLPVLGDVEPGEDLDAGDEGAGGDAARGGDRPQDAVDADPHLQVASLRFEMDVARPQPDGPVEKVVEGAHDRRTAGEVTQMVGAVDRGVGRGIGFCGGLGWGVVRVERQFDVLERGDLQAEGSAQRERDGIDRIRREGVGEREPLLTPRRAIGIEPRLMQEDGREGCGQRRAGADGLRVEPRQAELGGEEVGEGGRPHAAGADQPLAPGPGGALVALVQRDLAGFEGPERYQPPHEIAALHPMDRARPPWCAAAGRARRPAGGLPFRPARKDRKTIAPHRSRVPADRAAAPLWTARKA